jgi:hypothetical protein
MMPTNNGCPNNFRKLSQNAEIGLSILRKESDAPIANNAPGVAACPRINRNSFIKLGV